jgi:hypothetical protein
MAAVRPPKPLPMTITFNVVLRDGMMGVQTYTVDTVFHACTNFVRDRFIA